MKSTVSAAPTSAKQEFYKNVCQQLVALLEDETDVVANAANTAALLFSMLPDVSWVGFYLTQADQLVLGPFQGSPACSRIPFGKGVCGTAAVKLETIVVPDVDQFEGHIACDAGANSEIVVPLINWGKLLGVLDIDSASLSRFDEEDADGLESVAAIFLGSQVTDNLPLLDEEAESVTP